MRSVRARHGTALDDDDKTKRKHSNNNNINKQQPNKERKEMFYFLFLSFAGMCAVSFAGLAWQVSHLDAVRLRHSKTDFMNYEPVRRWQRRGKDVEMTQGSIRNVIQEHSIEKQITGYHVGGVSLPSNEHARNTANNQHVRLGNKDQAAFDPSVPNDRPDAHNDNRPPLPNSCDQLLGPEGIEEETQESSSSRCIKHSLLKWVVCVLPPLRLHLDNVPASLDNNKLVQHGLIGQQRQGEQGILWTPGMMEFAHAIPSAQLRMPMTETLQRFLFDGGTQIDPSIQADNDDNILTVLVFRETNSATEQGLILLYQTYAILRHLNVMENFRIIFMDVHAKTTMDDAWGKLFGTERVFHLRNFVQDTGISTFRRSIVVQPVSSALGEEAVTYFVAGEMCTGPSFLQDFRNELLGAYGMQSPTALVGEQSQSQMNQFVTLLWDKPLVTDPRANIPQNWTEPDLNQKTQVMQKVYNNTPSEHIRVATLEGLSFREQLALLVDTKVLVSAFQDGTLMSMFLPSGAQHVTFHRYSQRLHYILNTLNVTYEKQSIPKAIRDSWIFGRLVEPKDDTYDPRNIPSFQKTCDHLLGWDSIQAKGKCRMNTALTWTLCEMPPIRFRTDKIHGSTGNESIVEVKGRKEEEERLSFDDKSVEILGHVDSAMTTSCPKMKEIQNFWNILDSKPQDSHFEGAVVDPKPTILVFRDTYANPCWSVILAYQTWLMTRLFDMGENFRIVWMDGHAYTGIDDFWRDVFGPEVFHFNNFVKHTGITAFNRSYVVHGGRLALGNEALHAYHPGPNSLPCSTNSTLHDFRRFVLDRYGYEDNEDLSDNSEKKAKQLTFLIRKPYMAHPRADGTVDRTIRDLKESVDVLRLKFPDYQVKVVSFEGISFREQLAIIRETDLLVSVHGAGNVHVLFLPYHARFIEFYPKGYAERKRFQFMASALGISRRFVEAHSHRKKAHGLKEMELAEDIQNLVLD